MSEISGGHKITAFLLITTESDKTEEVLEKLKEKEEVREAYIIYGDWDLIVKVQLPTLPDLTKFVMLLRKIPGIQKTSTLITLSAK